MENIMGRLVIDVSHEQHKKIKAMATLQGKSIKDFVLEKILPAAIEEEDVAWEELKGLLLSRLGCLHRLARYI
jgi:hypothetical protein